MKRTILIEPGIAESFRLLGQIYLRQGRESAGEKALEAYEKVKSFEKEIDYFQERLRSDPDDGEAHYNLGYIYGRLGFTGVALPHYVRAVTINPGHIQALNNMGNIYFRTGHLDQAAAAYEQIMSADKEHVPALTLLAQVYLSQQRPQEAISALKTVVVDAMVR